MPKTDTAATVTSTVSAKSPKPPAEPEVFIIVVRSPRGTLHPVLDKNKGPGALATFDTAELAQIQTSNLEVCQRNPFFILPVS